MTGELSGLLRSRVAISRRSVERDAMGGACGDWIGLGEAWANLAPAGSGELGVADSRSAMPRWRVTLRAETDVAVGDRLLWRGRRLVVRRRIDDPAAPDRITIETEEER